ncbi:fumarylacetoacetate hydrolase family protein [Blastococcus haudaquaticus]|uniref:2-keto-4-pentenoate hydratase/2-oxohepta-3-ene-1,7-dioic acid hydratase (Catechol pathway) n=1 Tax=Blastococcus haudaquaticus TaxID=1938745 RepID=A0A286GTW5_9ACTN|nr:fumarylacetoacetate hydrolase family protein [Blastococcus haudaquaticus]SOD98971.1 2-keto-4-pentenoate hydratase/2-oxohepta-3-ene-1,7-dioic acid hydratase (catechol pathway) [Blastococcus haudaquaticus]
MRIARYIPAAGGDPAYGLVEGEGPDAVIVRLDGTPFDGIQPTDERAALADVTLLAPVEPSKVLCMGRNYAEHAKELGNEVPDIPVVFAKFSTSVTGPDSDLLYPALTENLHFEGELAIVIGRRCSKVSPEKAADVILGYTVANDLTLRDMQRAEKQWTRAKGFDGSCPLGPWVETDIDPSSLSLRTTVNGEVRQDGTTADMLLDVAGCVSWVSQTITLLPGDVVLTGTPAGVGSLQVGDEVAVTVEGIGTVTTRIIAG